VPAQGDFTVYRWPTAFTSVKLGDTECIGLGVREVAVNPYGKGWVILEKKLDGTGARTQVDNTPREYLFHGKVVIS